MADEQGKVRGCISEFGEVAFGPLARSARLVLYVLPAHGLYISLTDLNLDIHVLLEAESSLNRRNRALELFTIPRNRRASQAAFIVMFMQQFCGVNVIAYYSTNIFLQTGFDDQAAFLASFGFGCINFLFALPAIWTIDTFGRRNLLLTTFPLMALFMFMAGFAFWIPESNKAAHVGVVTLGMYLFGTSAISLAVTSH